MCWYMLNLWLSKEKKPWFTPSALPSGVNTRTMPISRRQQMQTWEGVSAMDSGGVDGLSHTSASES